MNELSSFLFRFKFPTGEFRSYIRINITNTLKIQNEMYWKLSRPSYLHVFKTAKLLNINSCCTIPKTTEKTRWNIELQRQVETSDIEVLLYEKKRRSENPRKTTGKLGTITQPIFAARKGIFYDKNWLFIMRLRKTDASYTGWSYCARVVWTMSKLSY